MLFFLSLYSSQYFTAFKACASRSQQRKLPSAYFPLAFSHSREQWHVMFVSPCIESGCHFLRAGRFSSCGDAPRHSHVGHPLHALILSASADCEKAARPTLQNGRKNFCLHYTYIIYDVQESGQTHTQTQVGGWRAERIGSLGRQPAHLLCCAGCLNCFLNTHSRLVRVYAKEAFVCVLAKRLYSSYAISASVI